MHPSELTVRKVYHGGADLHAAASGAAHGGAGRMKAEDEEQALFRNVLQLCRKIFLAIKEGVL